MSHDDVMVRFPHLYWLADFDSFGSLTQDPDEQDGKPARFKDKKLINWGAVGDTVAQIGYLLVNGQYQMDEENPEFAIVKSDLSGLSDEEQDIVFRWFRHGVSVSGDYGFLENGRHRLYNCWSVNQSLLLPVESAFLSATFEAEGDPKWQELPCWALERLEVTPRDTLKRSPLYSKELCSLAEKCVETDREASRDAIIYEPEQLSEFSLEEGRGAGTLVTRVRRFLEEIFT